MCTQRSETPCNVDNSQSHTTQSQYSTSPHSTQPGSTEPLDTEAQDARNMAFKFHNTCFEFFNEVLLEPHINKHDFK